MPLDLSLFAKILALVKAGIPLPSFADAAATEKWLVGLAPSEAALIAGLVSQFTAKGVVELALPDGSVVKLAQSCDGGCDCCITDADAAKVCAAAPEAFGDGKWLEAMKQAIALIPQIMAIFALFKSKDAPAPTPPINS
jgi:hypothetical protein